MELGLKVHQPGASFPEIKRLAQEAEGAGFESVWGFDHLQPVSGTACPEAYTTLSALATHIDSISLGVLVTSVGYRHPAVLANMVATLDRITEGRIELGLGAGSKGFGERDYAAFDLPFPDHLHRVRKLAEACQVITALWTNGSVTFEGQFYTLEGAECGTAPVSDPHPQIVIGGGSSRVLKVAVRHAQEWNYSLGTDLDPEPFVDANERVTQHCHAEGRDPGSLRRSVQVFWHEQPLDELAEAVGALDGAGTDRVVIIPKPPFDDGLATSLYDAVS